MTVKKPMKHSKPTKKLPARGSIRVVRCPMPPREPPLPTSTIIPLEESLKDSRGYIQNLVSRDIGSAVLIFSEKGSVRAEHWHRRDAHWCFLLSGSLLYMERPVGSDELPKVTTVVAGQLFFTPPGVEHSMYFRESSTFLTFSRPGFDRSQKAYEADLVRLEKKLTDIPVVRAMYLPMEQIVTQPEVTEKPTPAPETAPAQDMPGSIP